MRERGTLFFGETSAVQNQKLQHDKVRESRHNLVSQPPRYTLVVQPEAYRQSRQVQSEKTYRGDQNNGQISDRTQTAAPEQNQSR